jgi:hypothetical protein
MAIHTHTHAHTHTHMHSTCIKGFNSNHITLCLRKNKDDKNRKHYWKIKENYIMWVLEKYILKFDILFYTFD